MSRPGHLWLRRVEEGEGNDLSKAVSKRRVVILPSLLDIVYYRFSFL